MSILMSGADNSATRVPVAVRRWVLAAVDCGPERSSAHRGVLVWRPGEARGRLRPACWSQWAVRCPPARARFPYGLSVANERRPGDDRGVSRVVTGRRPGRPREDQRTLAHPLVEMLRTARQEAGWTQARLARHLGVVEQTVSAWECGRSPLYLHHAQRWADALELEVEWRLEERFRVKPTRI